MKIHLSPDEVKQACILYVSMHHQRFPGPALQFGDVEFCLYSQQCTTLHSEFEGAYVEIVEESDTPNEQ